VGALAERSSQQQENKGDRFKTPTMPVTINELNQIINVLKKAKIEDMDQ
jgi:hypothetical protein